MDWTLHDCKFALHDCWLKCKSQLIFFNLKNKLHTYIFFLTQPNVCHLFFWSYHFTEPLLREHIFSSRATDFCFCQWALSHDSLFLIRTNTRLRIMRAHSSTISVGAKESVSMFSRTIFYQLNNSSIQLWLHHDCYLLSKKKSKLSITKFGRHCLLLSGLQEQLVSKVDWCCIAMHSLLLFFPFPFVVFTLCNMSLRDKHTQTVYLPLYVNRTCAPHTWTGATLVQC